MTTLSFIRAAGGQALWWNALIGGVAAMVVGVLLLTAPAQTLLVLVQLLGIYWLVVGVLALVSIFVSQENWGLKLLIGVLGVLAGLGIVQHPLWSTVMLPTMLVIFLGVSGIIMGIAMIAGAFMGGGWGSAALGVVNIVFGALLLGSPLLTAAVLPFVLGIWGLVGGAVTVFGALQDRPATPEAGAPGVERRAA